MKWDIRRSVMAGLAFLAAGAALAAEPVPTPVAKARAAAQANAATAEGREWMKRHKSAAAPLLIPVLNRCLPEDGEEVTAFSLFLRLTRQGRVQEVVTDLDAKLSRCMTLVGQQQLQLPEAPRDDYWIQLNLAAEL